MMMMCRTVVGRGVDQLGSVVDGLDLHARRQQIAMIQIVNLLAEAGQRGKGLAALLQQHDAFDDVRILSFVAPTFPRRG